MIDNENSGYRVIVRRYRVWVEVMKMLVEIENDERFRLR